VYGSDKIFCTIRKPFHYASPKQGGGPRMTRKIEYRVYTFGLDGHILRANIIDCRDDDEAIEKTKQLVDGHILELWLGTTCLGRFEPGGSSH
jgi:hypothetical protein